jgi:RNA polymerase sigma factor (sigma-70 family)
MSEHASNSRAGVDELVEHLFRHEYGKLTSTLARAFGLDRLGIVEDIVQETLLTALRQWSFREVPQDATAWLYRVARNKALDHLRRDKVAAAFAQVALDESVAINELSLEPLDSEIVDNQLRMIFACCNPAISQESQIALTLKTLCGFSVAEIASAFLSNEATIEKRLHRTRKFFREHHVKLEPPAGKALATRIEPVLACLYLLFNEGYKRSYGEGLLQQDLCFEALRLALIVSENFGEESPESYALIALMLFHVARFDARTGADGCIVLLTEQDRSKWNAELIQRGLEYFARSAPAANSHYHFEAAIQSLHCIAPTYEATNWPAILGLYKRLNAINSSPIVLMHMSLAVSHVFGPEDALAILDNISFNDYYLYHAMRGEMLMKAGRFGEAATAFEQAISLSKNGAEKILFEQKFSKCLFEGFEGTQ